MSVTDIATGTNKTQGFNDGNTIGNDYNYDKNGNLVTDKNKKLKTIEYNYLNLPKKLIGNNNETIEYIYSANGQKLAKKSPTGVITNYDGNFVYEAGALKYILHGEGMVDMATSTPQYQYYMKDHLGNTRVMVNASGAVQQINSYYPFGLTAETFQSGTNNKYLYNGKELQDDKIGGESLEWYDYGARFYDAALGRFHAVDPLAEKFSHQSTYVYADNNPIRFIDIMGMNADWYEDKNQNVVYDESIKSQGDLDKKGIEGSYLGSQGSGVDSNTGSVIRYNTDGTETYGSTYGIPEVEVNAEMSDHVRTMSDPYVKAIHQGQKDFIEATVDQ